MSGLIPVKAGANTPRTMEDRDDDIDALISLGNASLTEWRNLITEFEHLRPFTEGGAPNATPRRALRLWDHFVGQPKQRMKGHSALLARI
jgi:hypothetical protein